MCLLQSLGKVCTKGELLNVTLKPTFSDGSKITLTLGDGDTVAIVPRSARDPDNNSIPDANVVDFVGVFSFSSAHTRERFVSVASHHGIAFVGVSASTLKLSCGWDDNTLTRSEEHRVGKEWVRKCRSRLSPDQYQKKKHTQEVRRYSKT